LKPAKPLISLKKDLTMPRMQFSVMLSPQEYDLIARAAHMAGSSMSRWIREVAVRAAGTTAPVREPDRRA
jgi:uncharacterized protein (DUF1778 family)